ncbi:transposase [Klebsiella pneumoniae]|nr:transposase [Klebsiella pneumoniae]
MTKETISMSLKELDRLQIIRDSVSRQITQEQAADRIGISIRQVKRLVQRYRIEGPLLRRNFGLSSSHLSEINIRISAPLLPVRNYGSSMSWLCRPKLCASGWLRKVYGVSAAEKLPAFISVGNGAHAMANLSRLMVLRMTGLKSEGLAVH